MTNRNRTLWLGLTMAVPCLLTVPLAYHTLMDGQFFSIALYLGFLLSGLGMVKNSLSKSTASWPYGVAALLLGYVGWECLEGAYHGFRGFGLDSLTQTSGALFGAWCCALCIMIVLGSMDAKKSLDKAPALPFGFTAWCLGGVSVLAGISGLLGMKMDGFFGTLSALGFALAILGFGVMLLRGIQPQFACYGLGAVTAGYTAWILFTDDFIRFVIKLSGTSLGIYGLFAAMAFVAAVGTFALGSEVAISQAKLSKKR